MSIDLVNWVWDHSRSRNGSRLVMLRLAWMTVNQGDWVWPSNETLRKYTGLKERAVQLALADLIKLGEVEVEYNGGQKGCNRCRVLTTPADFAPPQILHPAEDAPPQDVRGNESSQASGQDPADNAPPADFAGAQNMRDDPAESAPEKESEKKNSSTKSSKGGPGGATLFGDEEAKAAAGAKKPRKPRARVTEHPRFEEWFTAMPLRRERADAAVSYNRAIAEGADPDVLLAAARAYHHDERVLRGFIKHPATWLNKQCWLDEPAPSQRANGAGPGKPTNYTDEEYHGGWN